MFENKDNTEFTDDLIKAGQEPIIIKQKDSGDKKFIYTILILLVVLFIIALGVIGYLGSKFFGDGSTSTQQVATTIENNTPKAGNQTAVKTGVATVSVKAPVKSENATVKVTANETSQKNSDNDVDIAELESIVNESETKEPQKEQMQAKEQTPTQSSSGMQQAIGAAATASGKTKLTQEEMAKIAKMVAMELAKAQAAQKKESKQQTTNSATATDTTNEESLVKSLQEASTDTLQAQEVDVNAKVDSKKIKAGSGKKVDTFNKVVVQNSNNSDDEFAKLSSEIDNILAQDEVKQNKANKEITSKLQDVVKDRQRELRFIVVKKGDTLSSLAYKAYGRASAYVKIYKANPDLVKNPNRIYVGMKLRVPVDEEYKGN